MYHHKLIISKIETIYKRKANSEEIGNDFDIDDIDHILLTNSS
jgi:hypothetical protein